MIMHLSAFLLACLPVCMSVCLRLVRRPNSLSVSRPVSLSSRQFFCLPLVSLSVCLLSACAPLCILDMICTV